MKKKVVLTMMVAIVGVTMLGCNRGEQLKEPTEPVEVESTEKDEETLVIITPTEQPSELETEVEEKETTTQKEVLESEPKPQPKPQPTPTPTPNPTPQPTPEPQPEVEVEEPSGIVMEFKTTAYCNCSKCCGKWAGGATASGVMPTAGRTVAMGGVPFGTKIVINGHTYIVEDRGTPYGHVDIYFNTHQEALNYGLKYVTGEVIY